MYLPAANSQLSKTHAVWLTSNVVLHSLAFCESTSIPGLLGSAISAEPHSVIMFSSVSCQSWGLGGLLRSLAAASRSVVRRM